LRTSENSIKPLAAQQCLRWMVLRQQALFLLNCHHRPN
jgi:hypothetical protein